MTGAERRAVLDAVEELRQCFPKAKRPGKHERRVAQIAAKLEELAR